MRDLTLPTPVPAPPGPLTPSPAARRLLAAADRVVAAVARIVHLIPWRCPLSALGAHRRQPPTETTPAAPLAIVIDLRDRAS